ncbi:MAG TPA: vanadium-dependent haloperoxidase [Solirubrobacteraceae bacterium]|nr:vanadium-dependent haloperoxidase [Solirubrobacteraceae bacterium]
MTKRIALVATAAVFVVSFAMTAIASGRATRDRHSAARAHAAASQPDQVIQWNQELQKVLVAPGAQPASIHPTRTLAITQIAVYDAVNGIVGHRDPFLVDVGRIHDASPDAAAASAAHTALDALLPSQSAQIDAFFQSSLAQIGPGNRVDRGVAYGAEVANAVLAARANDGASATPPGFTPLTGPGEYQLTPPLFPAAGFTQTPNVTPFVLDSASQFRAPAPPALDSAQYATDFNEVKSLGRLTSTTRTADQTAIGKFWGAAPIWVVWNQIADLAGIGFGNSLAQNARLFAALDTTLADGAIALYDSKYAYHRWRPVTAITAADQGNPNTVADPTWVPLAVTANDPSYPGAHAEFSSAAAAVLQRFFHTDSFSFSLTNAGVGITRSFTSFSGASNEAFDSRIFAGQHFRYDQNAGQAQGTAVAAFVLDHAFGRGDRAGDADHRDGGRDHRDGR